MRWNRIITSVCIFLLSWSRILIVVVGAFMLIAIVSNRLESPFGFHVGDDYYFENTNTQILTASYKGMGYDNVIVKPDGYYIHLGEIPISKYWTIVPMALMAGLIYVFLELIIKLLKSIEEREFFSLINVKRLRIIGVMVMGFSIVRWLYSRFIDYFLDSVVEVEGLARDTTGLNLSWSFFSSLLFLGLMILLVANAFEHGLRLQKEQELTI